MLYMMCTKTSDQIRNSVQLGVHAHAFNCNNHSLTLL